MRVGVDTEYFDVISTTLFDVVPVPAALDGVCDGVPPAAALLACMAEAGGLAGVVGTLVNDVI